jgi:hypothetical protein
MKTEPAPVSWTGPRGRGGWIWCRPAPCTVGVQPHQVMSPEVAEPP